MVIFLRALLGVLLLDCMLYYTLRLALGKHRKVAGCIAIAALVLPLAVGTIGLMGVHFVALGQFRDESQVYRVLYDAFIRKGTAYIRAWQRPGMDFGQIALLVGMAVVALGNLAVVFVCVPSMFNEKFDWSRVHSVGEFFEQSITLYPVIAILVMLGWGLLVAVDIALCSGVHLLLYGVWPM